MTDRVKGIAVCLDDDYREDDLDSLVEAIKHFKGVVAVEKIYVGLDDFCNRKRIKYEYKKIIYECLEGM